jgi:hypothetical protein
MRLRSRRPITSIHPELSPAETIMSTGATSNQAFLSYYRCPEELGIFSSPDVLNLDLGFFSFGPNTIGYGRCSGGTQAKLNGLRLPDALRAVRCDGGTAWLPFNPTQVVDDLRHERYLANGGSERRLAHVLEDRVYYFFRPFLPLPVRKHLQRIHLSGRTKLPFPAWPVDETVERFMQTLLRILFRARGLQEIPFIWFWPDLYSSCAIVTHDVETAVGRNFCSQLMELDASRGIRSSFQVIPEQRYSISDAFLQNIQARGCEVNVHDLNHDGLLYRNYAEFKRRVRKINQYGRRFGAAGFRAGALYRNLEWYGDLEFAYDMSVPNAGHLEAQGGGCCTVMPYFIGHTLEIPVTTTQDYSLFHILKQYSIDLWKYEIDQLMGAHGLISFIVHPDYIVEKRARQTYTALLNYLAELREEHALWIALPSQLNKWWRERSHMRLVRELQGWKIEGIGSERARVAYAGLDGDRITYRIESKSGSVTHGNQELTTQRREETDREAA